jgi:hypothetical protein
LSRPKSRRTVESAFEEEPSILTFARDNMAPRLWQAIRGVHAEEVAARGLSKAVEMLVRPNEGRFRIQVNAGFLSYLPNRRLDQCLALVDTAGGNLNSRVGMIPVFEDEKPILSLDVDDNSLSAGHARIVGVARRGV